MSRGRPDDDELVFPARHGGPWRDGTWQSWHRDAWRPVTGALGIQGSRPYEYADVFVMPTLGWKSPQIGLIAA
jgi:hypothetical protein